MKILWISSLAWDFDRCSTDKLDGPGAISGSLFQKAIIEGLELHQDVHVDIISAYPYRCDINMERTLFSHVEGAQDVYIKHSSNHIKQLLFKFFRMNKEIKNKNYDIIAVYLVHSPFLVAALTAKKRNPGSKICLITPDLPEYMDFSLNEKLCKRLFKKLDHFLINHCLKHVDLFVNFTEGMNKIMNKKQRPSCVVEGVFNGQDLNFDPVEKEDFIMYAGTLHKNLGLQNLIEAVKELDCIDLKIFGTGDLQEYIEREALSCARVKYMGFQSREAVFQNEKKARILINCRNPEDTYTKYSFPSKMFEYMVSGTPLLTTCLEGIPDEYNDYLWLLNDNCKSTIKDGIISILNSDPNMVREKTKQAREFILACKNSRVQAEKLYELWK